MPDITPEFGPPTQIGTAVAGNIVKFVANQQIADSGVSVASPSYRTLTLTNLPTADPHVAGQVWSNGGVLTVSAG